MSSLTPTPWVSCAAPRPHARLRLFCFPYAGGGAHIFQSWQTRLPQSVEVYTVQLPGRGARMMEKPYNRMEPIVAALAQALPPLLEKPFAFFGHSMGAWIGFELAKRLRDECGLEPRHLFVSGSRAPRVPQRERPLHALPEGEFVEELRRLNGTPKDVLENDELMRLVTPTLRADFAVTETYVYTSAPPLTCPISAFGGIQDEWLRPGDLEAWREETSASFRLQILPGDHFFINTVGSLLLTRLSEDLERAAVTAD